jgi:hypothetical protein
MRVYALKLVVHFSYRDIDLLNYTVRDMQLSELFSWSCLQWLCIIDYIAIQDIIIPPKCLRKK